MTDTVKLALIVALPGILTACQGFWNSYQMRIGLREVRQAKEHAEAAAIIALETKAVVVETKEVIAEVKTQTDGMAKALAQKTGEVEFQKGKEAGAAEEKANGKNEK